ncbi:hypothetical protein ACQ4PT_033398 [Festuca glaucescens]
MGAAFLASWPWENLGMFKYALYGPLVGRAVASRAWEPGSPDRWLFLLLALFTLRALTYQLWSSYSNMLFLTRRRRIVKDGVDFEQIDKEWDWDNFLILHILIASAALYLIRSLRHLPAWDARGLLVAVILHVALTEPLYYAAHRAFHGGRIFARYHALHHSARVPTPFTAGFATPLEHLLLGGLMALPLAGACAAGRGSVALALAYVLGFDFLRAMGSCNVELFPAALFRAAPLLRYLVSPRRTTPSTTPGRHPTCASSCRSSTASAARSTPRRGSCRRRTEQVNLLTLLPVGRVQIPAMLPRSP